MKADAPRFSQYLFTNFEMTQLLELTNFSMLVQFAL